MAASTSYIVAVVALMAVLSAFAVSAQDLSPAPSPDAGAGYSVGASAAVICSSLVLSAFALLKN